jgi:hypothetical protein
MDREPSFAQLASEIVRILVVHPVRRFLAHRLIDLAWVAHLATANGVAASLGRAARRVAPGRPALVTERDAQANNKHGHQD